MSLFGKILGEGAEGFLSKAARGAKNIGAKAVRGASESAGAAASKLGKTSIGKKVSGTARRVAASTPAKAGKNLARGAGEGFKEMGQSAKKLGKGAIDAAKSPKTLKSRLTKIARNPAKMKALGKKLAKYGTAGAAGYAAAKMTSNDKD